MTASGSPATATPVRFLIPALVAPFLLAPVTVWLAGWARSPFLLPVLATAAVHPAVAYLTLKRRRAAAVLAALLWAASLSAAIVRVAARAPEATAPIVLGGEAYRDEMFAFLREGSGRESDPLRFVPQHVMHLALFGVLTLISGGLLGLGLGAVLVGYMSFYVGALAAAGDAPVTAMLFGWPPWAILRVVAFILLGIVLAEPLLGRAARRLGRDAPPSGSPRRMVMAAACLLLADVVLKATLARPWAALLRRCLP